MVTFFTFFSENDATRAVRVVQNSKVVARQRNNDLKLTIKLRKARELHIQLTILCMFMSTCLQTTYPWYLVLFPCLLQEVSAEPERAGSDEWLGRRSSWRRRWGVASSTWAWRGAEIHWEVWEVYIIYHTVQLHPGSVILTMCSIFDRVGGGLWLDIKRKIPWYCSDIYDGFHIQSISAVLFIYLGCITNAITFGGLLGDATDNYQVSITTATL